MAEEMAEDLQILLTLVLNLYRKLDLEEVEVEEDTVEEREVQDTILLQVRLVETVDMEVLEDIIQFQSPVLILELIVMETEEVVQVVYSRQLVIMVEQEVMV